MRLVCREAHVEPNLATGNPAWDQALRYYQTRYPRLMAHVGGIILGDEATLGIHNSPFKATFVLHRHCLPKTPFDATFQLGVYLHYLARHLRHVSRTKVSSPAPSEGPKG